MVYQKTVFVASDGKEFDHEQLAVDYENNLLKQHNEKFNRVYQENLPIDVYGKYVYMIEDEGPIDYSSSRRPKLLAFVRGTYKQVVEYALSLDGFWGYGPGKIRQLEVKELYK